MKSSVSFLIAFLFFELLFIATINFSFCNGSTSNVGCIKTERKALLMFKQDLNNTSNRLDSWIGADGDCCKWAGVVCHSITGHVLALHLGNPRTDPYLTFDGSESRNESEAEFDAFERSSLGGKLNPSLLDLKHLNYLDLSLNDFGGIQIPRFLASMESLIYLNISYAGFSGMIPHQFGNLSDLQYLDLSYNSLSAENLFWLSSLPLLEHLDLGYVNLSKASDWLLEINTLPSLKVLKLVGCELQHFPPLSIVNFSSLVTLDLSGNYYLSVENLFWLSSLPLLEHLDLSSVNLSKASDQLLEINTLPSLKVLKLVGCELQHFPPLSIVNFSSLVTLDLSHNYDLSTENLFWLSSLPLLEHLDLSRVNLSKASDRLLEINTLPSLKVLKLVGCELQHFPPLSIVNFSSLVTLDLSGNYYLSIENLFWLSSLPLLEHLDLSSVNLSKASDWLLEINTLPSLKVLKLYGCELQHFPPLSIVNFSSLVTLDLSGSLYFMSNAVIPSWVFGLSHLQFLDMSFNYLQGPIPDGLQNLTSLIHLDLSVNSFNSSIPMWLYSLTHLQYLSLSGNNLQGMISGAIVNLTFIERLDLSYNYKLEGRIPRSFGRLCNLRTISFSYVKLSQAISEILDIFSGCLSDKLESLDLSSNQIFGFLTNQFGQFKNLYDFSLMNNSILGPIPSSFGELCSLEYLDVSSNKLNGTLSKIHFRNLTKLFSLDLSDNQIHGEIPSLPKEIRFDSLNLSSNDLSGPLPLIYPKYEFDLSNNKFSGSISHFVCHRIHESKETEVLKLRGNFLSEELPDCWKIWPFLTVLDLGTNKFTGNLPISMGTLSELRSLRLRKNNLSGTIPASLGNCTELETLDVGENELVGTIPIWLGERLSSMLILNLRSNKFHDFLPRELCNLASLQILDVAHNNLSGSIPRCISNISAMVTVDSSNVQNGVYYQTNYTSVTEDASLVMKGQMAEYNTILNLVRIIDLSKNNFSGEIPIEVTSLAALQSLNLSYNSFTGKIPANFGAMKSLESVDFSWNQLSGEIPRSLSSLNFLSYLNLSNNNLIGKIPMSTQLQTFDPTCFMGNELCGSPLPKNCTSPTPGRNENDGEHEVDWFYVSMALGFVVGFWSLIGPLIVNRRWRYMYCRFLDRLGKIIGSIVRKCF